MQGLVDAFSRDVRHALKSFAADRAFALTALATLALAIGATTAIFSLVNGVILRPLPFPEAESLVQVHGTSALVAQTDAVSNLGTLRQDATAFEALVGYEVGAAYLRATPSPERVMTVRAQPEFFTMLRVPPAAGRVFRTGDPPDVAVVSDPFAARLFGDRASAIGRTLVLDGRTFTIVGVMASSFQFPYRAASLLSGSAPEARTDIWIPLDPPLSPRGRIGHVTGRVRAGVTRAAAAEELSGIAARIDAALPTRTGRGVRIEPLADAVVPAAIRRVMFLLFGAAGLVLAIACVNVANLSLARMMVKSREVAVRSALGAGRARLARQYMTESLVLAIAGGAAGLALAWWIDRRLLAVVTPWMPRVHEVGLDWRVFAFLCVACLMTAAGLAVAPVIYASRRDPRSLLQQSGGGSIAPGPRRVREALVIAEVALAFVLAVGATLLIRELVRLRHTDTGMTSANVMTFHLGHRMTAGTDPRQFYEIADRAARLPGVDAAGFIQMLPLQNWGWLSNSTDFTVRGRPPISPVFPIELRYVTPGYFDAFGIGIKRGRGFTARDTREAPIALVINETLARRVFGDEDPIGQVTTRGVVVGVAGDVRQVHLDRPPAPEIYYAVAQNWSQVSDLGMTLGVRTEGRPERIVDAVRSIVGEVNPSLAIFNVKTLDEVIDDSLSGFTMYLALVAAFAGVALILASVGTYGVIAYVTRSRTREYAIRMALGADRARVMRFVVGQGARLAGIGLAVGAAVVPLAAPLLRDVPIAIRRPDLITMAPVALVVALLAGMACAIPARRAADADPAIALRAE